MHARHRNGPVNGHYSNAMGTRGQASASRISPESSMRGQRMYNNSEFRSYNRGSLYGRGGPPKQFQPPPPPPPPPRGADIFMEAGRLAAEYLVSKGVLPPNALSGKWQNDVQMSMDGRAPVVHSHVESAALDVGPGRRRYSDEFNSMGSRNNIRGRGRKRTGSVKSGSWAEKSMVSVGKGGDVEMESLSPGELTQESGGAARLASEEDAGAQSSSSNSEKKPAKESSDGNKSSSEGANEGKNDNDLEKKQDENEVLRASAREDGFESNNFVDLVKHFKFGKVPTRARSSLTIKGTKGDKKYGQNNTEQELSEGSGVHILDAQNDSNNASSSQIQELNSLGPDVKNQELDEELSVVGSSSSTFMEKCAKRAIDDNVTDGREDFKRLREWTPVDALSNENQQNSQKSAEVSLSPDQKNLKQLFPGSFKTCDLNLLGTSDATENHDADRVFIFSSVAETEKGTAPIDVDLSMSNNRNPTHKNVKFGANVNDIEIIDLENDSAQEDNTFSQPERGDAVFTDPFPSNVHNANEDVHNGYGLMFSDLLGNDSPNCSSVPTGLNSLHADMGLPNEEGILGDDDSIYMSLGEIPISFMGTWEQPSQDYGKPF